MCKIKNVHHTDITSMSSCAFVPSAASQPLLQLRNNILHQYFETLFGRL